MSLAAAGETAVRVAAAGHTGAAMGGPLPSLLGVDFRAKGPLGGPLSSRAAREAAATAGAAAEERPRDEKSKREGGDSGVQQSKQDEGDTKPLDPAETLDVSVGVSLAFGKRADLILEPRYHPRERY